MELFEKDPAEIVADFKERGLIRDPEFSSQSGSLDKRFQGDRAEAMDSSGTSEAHTDRTRGRGRTDPSRTGYRDLQ